MGVRTTITGELPPHLGILVNTTARIESLVIEAAMKKSQEIGIPGGIYGSSRFGCVAAGGDSPYV